MNMFSTSSEALGIIISESGDDEYVPVDGTIDHYNRIVKATFDGDMSEARKNVRLFLQPGNDRTQSLINDYGYGSCLSDSMIALMRWVEEDIAPDVLPAVRLDNVAHEVEAEGEVFVY